MEGQHMKAKLVLLLFAAVAFAPAAETNPFTGKWQIHLRVADREADRTCTFTQTGKELTGSCDTEAGDAIKLVGTVDDAKITWKVSGEYTLTYRGTLDKTGEVASISGSVTVEEYGIEGEFLATQAK